MAGKGKRRPSSPAPVEPRGTITHSRADAVGGQSADNPAMPSPSAAVKIGVTVAAFALLAAGAWLLPATMPTAEQRAAGEDLHYGIWALAPAVIAIGLAFLTRQVLLALFLGVAAGGVVYAFAAPVEHGFELWRLNILQQFLLPAVGSTDYAIILVVYLWALGGLIGLWTRTGGALLFAEWMGARMVRGPRSAKVFTWVLGMVFHQGGTISTVLAGTTARPVLEKHRISKEESAYLVDSTASPVATIIPFNVWPIYVGGLIVGLIPPFTGATDAESAQLAISFFFTSIPFNFYAILAVVLTLLVALNWGPRLPPMRQAMERAEKEGKLVRDEAKPLTSEELTQLKVPAGYPAGMADFLLPLGFLLGIAIIPYVITSILGSPKLLISEAFLGAVLVGVVVALYKGMPISEVLGGIVDGAKGVTIGAIILALAVTLKEVSITLNAGGFLVAALGDMNPAILPAILLLLGMVTAFSTGTSFGTFAVIFPLAMPLAWGLVPEAGFIALCFGAIVGGSVFGDQCSPISDTTILSSLAVGSDLMDHVTTQLPYASLAAGVALLGYLALGFGMYG